MSNKPSAVKNMKRSPLLLEKITDKLLKSLTLYLKQNQSSSNNVSLRNFLIEDKHRMSRKRRIINKIQEKFLSRQEVEKVNIIKHICLTNQPVVKLCNILREEYDPVVDINYFARQLNLSPKEGKVEEKESSRLKSIRYNGNIPFSSNLGKLFVETDTYRVSQPLIIRKQEKIDHYLKQPTTTPIIKNYPITYKDKLICDRVYNYPGRVRLQSENCISDVPKIAEVKIRPVSVVLTRMDLSGFTKEVKVVVNKINIDKVNIKKGQKRKSTDCLD